jgi:hypothetical protein
MKANLPQSHLALLSFASLEFYFASFRFVSLLFRIRSFGAPYLHLLYFHEVRRGPGPNSEVFLSHKMYLFRENEHKFCHNQNL